MEKTAIQNYRDAQVVKSNDLIQRTRYNLSVSEQRLLLFLIARISPYDEELPEITFTIADFFKVIGVQYNGVNYIECKDIIRGLASKPFWMRDEKGDHLCFWIKDADIDHGGTITIKLDKKLEPYLTRLRQNFTTYELAYTLQFKSKYSTRLYEFAKSVKYNNLDKNFVYRTEPEQLRDLLGVVHRDKDGKVTKEEYPRYTNFKQRVLMPAIEEINRQTDIRIELSEVKEKKKVVGILLTIGVKDVTERLTIRDEIDRVLDIAAGINPNQTKMEGF